MNFKYLYSWVGDIHKKPQTRLMVWSFIAYKLTTE
jgi:hypothetical protein